MKREVIKFLSLIGLGSTLTLLVAGCSTDRAHTPVAVTPEGQVVAVAPPPPRVEPVRPAPGTSYVWVGGYWVYRADQWVWIPGHWSLRPRTGVTWVPGHWDQTDRGWVWTPGWWE